MKIQEVVREVRKGAGLTQQQLADQLGVKLRTIVRYENDQPPTGVALKRLWQIADGVGLAEAAQSLRTAYLKEIEERDGLVGKFAIEGPTRDRIARTVESLRPILGGKSAKQTSAEAETTLQKTAELIDRQLLPELLIYQQILNSLGSINASAQPKPGDTTSIVERAKLARQSFAELDECLNSFYIVGPMKHSSKD